MSTESIDRSATDTEHDLVQASELPIQTVPPDAYRRWLRQGWATLTKTPFVSLFYGLLCASAGFAALMMSRAMPGFTVKFLIALLLLGPFLAAGLYVTARRHLAGEQIGIRASFALYGERRSSLALFGLFLVFVVAVWMMASVVLFAIKVTTLAPTSSGYVTVLGGGVDPLTTVFMLASGALLAAAVFAASAIAVPLIVDRDAGPIAGVQASWRAVTLNIGPMLRWAGVIVGLMVIGALTAFVGMLVIFPLLGYASWYAYRDLVGESH
ncbi:DUF2189 domain-containing protein [Halochromatium glycolicum]|jgi:uncharacterized membrane protein|uniref:DUF2189 domain-containing protein n=1 Tax=Halochromatium glycolicum TaxID=85075 RepID=A0AAJ0U585_9GAMM|nr:DUF2189 domain-containing protein [Halochromatium glycolicum]MBK1705358.1 hypothetical protein [Halochromatium glycolicum]